MPAVFYVSYVSLWLLVLALATLLLLVYRHFGLMALGTVEGVQRDGLAVGSEAPKFSAVTLAGDTILWEPRRERPQLLAFVSPECQPCARILPSLNQVARADGGVEVILLVSGPVEGAHHLVEKFHPPAAAVCLADDGSGADARYKVRVTPFAFLIGQDGRVLAKGLCDQPARLQQLLASGGLDVPELLQVVKRSAL
jgi:methylamine dehydrogenase accessory protein MauD